MSIEMTPREADWIISEYADEIDCEATSFGDTGSTKVSYWECSESLDSLMVQVDKYVKRSSDSLSVIQSFKLVLDGASEEIARNDELSIQEAAAIAFAKGLVSGQ